MNLSLRNRVTISFVCANAVVLILSFIVFHYLDTLNKDIKSITVKTNKVSLLTDEIRISAISILKYQRKILSRRATPELIENIIGLCDSFTSQLHQLDAIYKEAEIKKIVAKMLSYVDSLKVVLGKASLFHRDNIGMASIGELADKILDTFSEFQDIQYLQSISRDKKIKSIIDETKKHMMISLIIGFFGTIIIGLVIPGKIALPFKKIKDAIRELQECNFDVSIYYSQDDEIGEIATEMNKMIHSFKVFEELRTDRINVENRKFDVLANMVKRPVLLANAQGKLIYLNNQLYSLLQVQSEDVIGKLISEQNLAPSIIEAYELAIKRRSKIENVEIKIPVKKNNHEVTSTDNGASIVETDDEGNVIIKEAPKEEYIYEGYGNVIPIRGKDSSLDYYLMVLSKEVIA